MTRLHLAKKRSGLLTLSLLSLAVVIVLVHQLSAPSYGELLGNRELRLSQNTPSSSASYRLAFDMPSASMLGSVRIQFCSNDPLPYQPCTVPAGLNVGSSTLSTQTGLGDFSISGASTANELILTRSPSNVPVGPLSFDFSNVINPSSPGGYYVRLKTYASNNATGSATYDGGIAYVITNDVSITATVPPYLVFCTGTTIPTNNCASASGSYVDFGELSSSSARTGTSQMLVATNAVDGYNVTVQGTTLTSGVNEITAMPGDVSRPGTAQFGFNLRANGTPGVGKNPTGPGTGIPMTAYNTANTYRLVSGDMIVSNTKPDDLRLYTVSYIANVPKTQAPGIYVSTLTYICLASF